MGFAGEKAGQNNMLKWILSGSIVAWTQNDDLPKFIEKLTGYRDLNKKNIDNKIGLWFLN
jgi:hypothetical protein